jgi:hypothetical protein
MHSRPGVTSRSGEYFHWLYHQIVLVDSLPYYRIV